MEETTWKNLLKFNGNHGQLVGLRIVNNILTAITLGFYYPWAKVSILKYLYSETEYMQTRFVFHGLGKEVFKGFLKALLIFGALYGFLLYAISTHDQSMFYLGLIVFYVGFFLLIPLAIHGSYRYRLSRTSWRGIHFGYRGNLKEFYKLYLKNIFLSVITFGIYSSWMHVEVNSYIRRNIRFGNIEFRYDGQGKDLFFIKLKGLLLSLITFGIYSFWYYKDLIAFEVNNTKMIQNGKEIELKSTLTAGQIFSMLITNYFIIIFTLGIGTGIAINRVLRVAFENIAFDSEIDPDAILQTEEEYKDATGGDLAGFLDISII
jgi:uncharacterized membrane protein YjgN (DUF898 family)